jgi:putative ABC transport system ATP-binding protein
MIRTRGLAAAFAGGPLIHFPDVDLPQGSVLLLRGPSGSGKSTWLAVVAGLLAAQQGSLDVAGAPMAASGPAADTWRARHVGFLPQKLHLSAALTVEQNLALVHWAAGLPPDPARIARTLAALGVADLAQRRPHALSGGQAQRVALARAVLLTPNVLLADEPTASLDDEAAYAALALLLHTAAQAQATLVLATHDARAVQALHAAAAPAGQPSQQGLVLHQMTLQRLQPLAL